MDHEHTGTREEQARNIISQYDTLEAHHFIHYFLCSALLQYFFVRLFKRTSGVDVCDRHSTFNIHIRSE